MKKNRYIKPSIHGLTHNRYDIGDFVWFHTGGIDYQCVVKKIFTETDEMETKVSYYIQILDTPMDVPYLVKEQDELYESRADLRMGVE